MLLFSLGYIYLILRPQEHEMIFFCLNYILMHEILELKDKIQIYSAISTVKGCFYFTEKFKYIDIFI